MRRWPRQGRNRCLGKVRSALCAIGAQSVSGYGAHALASYSFRISEGGSHYVSETTPGFDLPLFNLTRHSSCINRNNFYPCALDYDLNRHREVERYLGFCIKKCFT